MTRPVLVDNVQSLDVTGPAQPPPEGTTMQIAILLYDGLAALDAVGPFEVLSHLPDSQIVIVGEHTGPVRASGGKLGLLVDATLDEVTSPDVVLVPGGSGKSAHMADGPVHEWLRTWTPPPHGPRRCAPGH